MLAETANLGGTGNFQKKENNASSSHYKRQGMGSGRNKSLNLNHSGVVHKKNSSLLVQNKSKEF